MFVSGFLDLFGRSTCHMSTRLSSSSTLMEGMEAVKFEGGRSDRKRELGELIKASHLNFIALSMPQVLNDYIYIMISSQGKERTCGSIAAKAFQPALIDSTSTFNSW